MGQFLPSWTRIRVRIPNPDPLTWLNPDLKKHIVFKMHFCPCVEHTNFTESVVLCCKSRVRIWKDYFGSDHAVKFWIRLAPDSRLFSLLLVFATKGTNSNTIEYDSSCIEFLHWKLPSLYAYLFRPTVKYSRSFFLASRFLFLYAFEAFVLCVLFSCI